MITRIFLALAALEGFAVKLAFEIDGHHVASNARNPLEQSLMPQTWIRLLASRALEGACARLLLAGEAVLDAADRVLDLAFQLIGALNPCPCGYLGDEHGRCRCTAEQVQRYRSRLSGPLIDRLDALKRTTLSLPERMPGAAVARLSKLKSTWPDSSASCAGLPPL